MNDNLSLSAFDVAQIHKLRVIKLKHEFEKSFRNHVGLDRGNSFYVDRHELFHFIDIDNNGFIETTNHDAVVRIL